MTLEVTCAICGGDNHIEHACQKGETPRTDAVTLPGFRITGKKGFHITFENGYTVSVQFGPGNYCDNYDLDIGREEESAGERGSSNAEVAWWGPDGEMIEFPDGDSVDGRQTPEQVLALFNKAASMPSSTR